LGGFCLSNASLQSFGCLCVGLVDHILIRGTAIICAAAAGAEEQRSQHEEQNNIDWFLFHIFFLSLLIIDLPIIHKMWHSV
jgi:hypothetical protein